MVLSPLRFKNKEAKQIPLLIFRGEIRYFLRGVYPVE